MNTQTPQEKRQFRRWLIRALLRAALVVVLVTVAVFFIIRLVPGDPAVMVLGDHATTESIEALRDKLNLNLPVWQQFARFLQNVFLRADTGDSIKYGVSSRQLVLQFAPVTLGLVALSSLITLVFSILLAFLAATHKDGPFDQLVRIVPAFTQGMPVFWTGLLFILLFAVNLRWFPVGGVKSGALGMLHSLILPAITVSFGQIPPLVRSLRERLLEVLEADFVPTLMLFSVNLSYLIGGTLVVEQVFAVRGVGSLLFEAVSNRDFPLVQAVALYCAVFVVIISFLADLIAHRVDPRGRT